MELRPSTGLRIDIHQRFRQGCKGMPTEVALHGNAMHVAVATKLLQKHRPYVTITEEGEPVQLCSLEHYASSLLESYMEDTEVSSHRFLLHTIPEELLVEYAERHDIAIHREEKSDVRRMLENVGNNQPQTFFSLSKSMERLRQQTEDLQKQ